MIFWKYISPSIFWMIVMALALFYNFKGLAPDMSVSSVDKFAHFSLFFVLAMCYHWMLGHPFFSRFFCKWSFAVVFVLGFLVGAITEGIQEFCLDHRKGEWGDLFWDALGVVFGGLVSAVFVKRYAYRENDV